MSRPWSAWSWAPAATGRRCAPPPRFSPSSASPTKRASSRRTACPTTCSPTPKAPRRAGCRRSSPAPAAPPTCPACWPPRRPCRCSACRSRAGTCRASIRCYSIVQMPKGIPVATFAIGSAGAANAALFAVAMLAGGDAALRGRLDAYPRAPDRGGAGDERRAEVTARRRRVGRRARRRGAARRTSRPGATLGVLGGGQLGRMFVHAAQSMGYRTAVLDPDPLSPAGLVAPRAHPRRLHSTPHGARRGSPSAAPRSPPSSRTCRPPRSRRWRWRRPVAPAAGGGGDVPGPARREGGLRAQRRRLRAARRRSTTRARPRPRRRRRCCPAS